MWRGRWGQDPLLAVERHPRYRARRRAEVRTAAQIVAALVAIVTALDLATLGSRAPVLVPVNIAGIVFELAACVLVRRPLRRHPEAVTLFIGFVSIATTVIPYAVDNSIAFMLLAYVALIIVAAALFVPWSPRMHVAWVATCLVVVAALVVSPLGGTLDLESNGRGTPDLIQISLASALVSLAGYAVVELRRLRAQATELQVRALHERTREQQAELLRLYAELEIVARTDSLTRTGNRVRLREDEGRLCAASTGSASDSVRAAALVDLDRFKRYNDRYGHLAGDDVLSRVAGALRSMPHADVYRFGGEEFLLVASFASVADAATALDSLRRAVAELGIAHADNLPWRRLTISIGVDVRETRVPIDLQSWIRNADAALYRAKTAGRNAMCLARPDGAEELWTSGRMAEDIPA